jgi:DNA (cytosine-5)-methyltransferase 1
MKQIELFAGIGGFGLAGEWAGIETVCQVEIDPFCQKVLQKNFPNAQRHSDIKTFDGHPFRGTVDLVSGGFPCQPYSTAGKRAGNDDDRALWPEMLRVIGEVAPRWVVGENVAGLISMDGGRVFAGIVANLEGIGYSVEAFVIPACAVGAPHRRDRIWIVAHCNNVERDGGGRTWRGRGESSNKNIITAHATCGRCGGRPDNEREGATSGGGAEASGSESIADPSRQRCGKARANCERPPERITGDNHALNPDATSGGLRRGKAQGESGFGTLVDQDAANANGQGLEKRKSQPGNDGQKCPPAFGNPWSEHWLQTATRICGMDDGLSRKLDRGKRLKALGNAIVPQIAFQIFSAIKNAETQ